MKALLTVPTCPLVLWDHACILDMLNRKREAAQVYGKLIRRGVHSLAYGECGEGLAWARGLVADSLYRLGGCRGALGQRSLSLRAYKQALRMRGPGCRSIYPVVEVRRKLAEARDVA